MIHHGIFTLVLSVFLLGVAKFYPIIQPSNPFSPETGLVAMTVCNGEVDSKINLGQTGRVKSYTYEQEEATTIWLEVVPEQMKFDQDTITVKAGKKTIIELDNLDGMQHNLLILKPNTLEIVGAAADAMLRDPSASEKHYVPEIPEVLFATTMLGPNEVYSLKFTAPTTPGNYPFVCTFPGHWRMMRGIMVVEKS